MQKTILFLCYTLLTINCFSQTTTLDVRIEPESDNDISNDNGVAILAVEDGFLISGALWCRNDDMCCADCSNLLKIDLDGNLLWQKLYNEFPCQFVLTQASLVKYTDEHLVSAVLQKCSDETNIRAGIIRLNPENGDSLFHKKIATETVASPYAAVQIMNDSIYTRVYLEDFGAGNRTVVAFYDAVNDTIFKQKIFDLKKVDLRGTADKTVDSGLILTERYATVYQFPPPANPWITENRHGATVLRVSAEGDSLWTKNLNTVRESECFAHVQSMPNGNYAVSWCADTIINGNLWNYRRPDWVGVLSEDGSELLWQHFFLSEYVKKVIRIRIAANGDILGMGYSRNPVLDYEASHWLFRLSPTGELLWEREYLRNEYFNSIGWRDNYLFDLTETADGKIACVGSTTYSENGSALENSVRLIVLDENGCLTPDCGDIIFLDVPEIEDNILLTEDKYPVYVSPNPAQTQAKIRYFLPEKHQTAIFQLYDIQGRLAQTHELATTEHNYNFEVTDLAAGVYMYQVLLENEIVKSGKLVVRN